MTKQLLERALELTKDVLDSLEDWAGYAPTYFKEKHGYDEDLASYDQRIKDLEAAIASWSDEHVAVVRRAYQAGAEAEREACACICDVRADNGDDSAYLLANEIRERGTT